MSKERLHRSRSQRRWLEDEDRRLELEAEVQDAEKAVAKAVSGLVRAHIALAEAQRNEDARGREMLGGEPSE